MDRLTIYLASAILVLIVVAIIVTGLLWSVHSKTSRNDDKFYLTDYENNDQNNQKIIQMLNMLHNPNIRGILSNIDRRIMQEQSIPVLSDQLSEATSKYYQQFTDKVDPVDLKKELRPIIFYVYAKTAANFLANKIAATFYYAIFLNDLLVSNAEKIPAACYDLLLTISNMFQLKAVNAAPENPYRAFLDYHFNALYIMKRS